MTEQTAQVSMSIILNAGDARLALKEAVTFTLNLEYDKAEEKMALANQKIVVAHQIQTDAIQSEVTGESKEYSVLFAHAQDTLMTVYSEIYQTKNLIAVFKQLNERIERLEKSHG